MELIKSCSVPFVTLQAMPVCAAMAVCAPTSDKLLALPEQMFA